MRIKEIFLDLLFPPRCAFCQEFGVHGVCPSCEKSLPYTDVPCCTGAGFGVCVSPLLYEGIARESILRFKFRGGKGNAEGYGRLLAQSVAEAFSGEFDLVTWVPISAQRKRERGYDQAYLLAQETAKLWDTEPVQLLTKTRHNAAQSTLNSASARRANVLGVYETCNASAWKGKNILLIDDILTTGATLAECVRVLREDGAKNVVCATLARTAAATR